jgi:hypothetical protein
MIFSPGLFGYLDSPTRISAHLMGRERTELTRNRQNPEPEYKTMKMKSHLTGVAFAALLIAGAALPANAEDAAPPKDQPAAPAATTQPETPPPSVPRPSIAPKTEEPPAAPVADEPPPPGHRRYAHRRHYWRHHYAYWEPFPILWPHVYHNRLYWSRVPWTWRF